jgi:hypothetical protein
MATTKMRTKAAKRTKKPATGSAGATVLREQQQREAIAEGAVQDGMSNVVDLTGHLTLQAIREMVRARCKRREAEERTDQAALHIAERLLSGRMESAEQQDRLRACLEDWLEGLARET